MMKQRFLALCSLLLLTSCAGVAVKKTTVAVSGAPAPRSIYIRPFGIEQAQFNGAHRGGLGERPIRRAMAPLEFANDLKEELEKIAPSMVLKDDEEPKAGWLVEGEFVIVDAGSPIWRKIAGHVGAGQSKVQLLVRVTDVGRHAAQTEGKNAVDDHKAVATATGDVIYEFELDGGSRLTGQAGMLTAAGLGDPTPFDFRNAAERIMIALSPDPYRYGVRTSPTIR